MTNPNDPVFTDKAGEYWNGEGKLLNVINGLTKREYFAGLAMQGFISSPEYWDNSFTGHAGQWNWKCIAQASLGMADALIDELNDPIQEGRSHESGGGGVTR